MFSEHLFTHKYDIDQLISALCTPPHQADFWLLNTKKGTLSEINQKQADMYNQPEKDILQHQHTFVLEPLPAIFIGELKKHPKFKQVEQIIQAEISEILNQTTAPQQLPKAFEHGLAGGWLRERVKEVALEWLDRHDLIPPSMKHGGMGNQFALPQPAPQPVKILLKSE